jgi:hypothetical protein
MTDILNDRTPNGAEQRLVPNNVVLETYPEYRKHRLHCWVDAQPITQTLKVPYDRIVYLLPLGPSQSSVS